MQYEYKPSLSAMLSGICLSSMCAAISWSVARLNEGLAIGGIELSPHAATVFWCVLFTLSLGMCLFLAFMAGRRLRHPQRIVLTPTAIIVPRSRWSCNEITIPYASISAVRKTTAGREAFLIMTHQGRESKIVASFLAAPQFLDDIRFTLKSRIDAAKGTVEPELEAFDEGGGE